MNHDEECGGDGYLRDGPWGGNVECPSCEDAKKNLNSVYRLQDQSIPKAIDLLYEVFNTYLLDGDFALIDFILLNLLQNNSHWPNILQFRPEVQLSILTITSPAKTKLKNRISIYKEIYANLNSENKDKILKRLE